MSRRLRGILTNAATFGVTIILVLAVFEVVLRAMPSLIAFPVLERMPSDLRAEIAEEIGIPTPGTLFKIASEERFDRGPDLYAYMPSHPHTLWADPEDKAFGAVEVVPIDSKGFCNPAGKDQRSNVDIVVIGDSFTFCVAVVPEDTSVAMLEDMTGLKTYDLGVGGSGPYEYIELLRRNGLDLAPRVVVMNVYGGNDLSNIDRYLDFVSGTPQPCGKKCKHAPGGILSMSYALAYLVAGGEELAKRMRPESPDNFEYTVLAHGERIRHIHSAAQDEARYGRMILDGSVTPALLEPPLATFGALAKEYGFVPLVAYIPAAYTAYQDNAEFEDPDIAKAVTALADAQRDWLAENAERLGIHFLDLVPAFRDAVGTSPLTHFPLNNHLTPTGHRIVAEAEAQEILRLLEQLP